MPFHLRALPGLLLAGLLSACSGGVQGFAFISDVNGAYLPAGPVGSTYIVEGIQFGDTQGDANVYFTNSVGGTALIAPVSFWSNNFVIGTVPAGAVSGPLVLNNGNGPNNGLTFFSVTPAAPFTPASATWTSGSALPVGLSGHAVAFGTLMGGTRAVYVVGGADSTDTPGNTVLYATAPASGALSAWQSTTSTNLPPIAFHAAVVAVPSNSAVNGQGYLIVLGGVTDHTGTSTNQIWRGTLNADGTVASWSHSAGDTLPAALHSFGATIFFGHVYLVGGATSNNTPVATVYRAVIKPDGTLLLPWTVETPLPFPRSHFGFGQFNGSLYVVGGDSGKVTPNDSLVTASAVSDIHLAAIDLYSRDLKTGWVKSASGLSGPRTSATAVVGGAPGAGSVLASGGLYAGAPTGEESYGAITAATGGVGAFSTAANTINAQCGCNIFNHAATSYTDGNGNFHAIVIGGDDAATPGKKHKQVYTY